MIVDNAIVYDIECLPNITTFAMEMLNSDTRAVWEISEFRDDRKELLEFFQWLARTQTPMIGFNNVGYDYPVIHELWKNPYISYQNLRVKSDLIIKGNDRKNNIVWASNRFAPQIDLYTMHHFDNSNKHTSLKALQINMRSPNVVEAGLPFDQPVNISDRDKILIPYNQHDVSETKRFAHYSMGAIKFRLDMINQYGVDVLNWNDTKIGEQLMIQKLGDDICYDRSSGKKLSRQTYRSSVDLNRIIFPYIRFENPEFNRVLNYMRGQVLRAEDWESDDDKPPLIATKGVFKGLKAVVGGVTYHYGVGGIHGSLKKQNAYSGGGYKIEDTDVGAMYPNIGIKNKLYPEHLGSKFVQEYARLPIERKEWQKKLGKKCGPANVIKLAQNGGVYGKSNSMYSPMFDPQYMLTITINGQLMLSMLIEQLVKVPTLQVIQANTDGVTYFVHESYLPIVNDIKKRWQELTLLELEDAHYGKMFIADVNNYIAVGINDSIKLKGKYWTPDPLNYHQSIIDAGVWHKNFSNTISTRAAVAHMVEGADIESYIRSCKDPYDFCCAVKIRKSDKLMHLGIEQQKNTRFYITNIGGQLTKILPARGKIGAYKKSNGISDELYESIMAQTGGQWDERVCTKNKSKYNIEEKQIIAGYNVKIVNNINDFDWSIINYDWYINEAKELLI